MRYPIFLAEKGLIRVCAVPDDLYVTSMRMLAQQFYKGIQVIDGRGVEFMIEGYSSTRPKRKILYFLRLSLLVRADFVFKETGERYDLRRFKEFVLKQIKLRPDFWDCGGVYEERAPEVLAAKSIQEIAALIK